MVNQRIRILVSLVICFTATSVTSTKAIQAKPFSFASYYGDHMVLQKAPQRANIWGYASKEAEPITVSVPGKGSVNTTSYIGPIPSVPVWTAQLPAIDAGGPYNITATSAEGTISLTDVLFGDVWICSGQSNMQFTMSMGYNASAEIAEAKNYPNIRVFTVTLEPSSVVEYDLLSIAERWSVASNDSIGGKAWSYFSAVCWLYGKYLSSHVNYPIGLLATSYGGTRVEAWSSPSVLTKCGVHGIQSQESVNPNAASVLWNAMVHPLLNMTIYGAIWYQGEANASPSANMDFYNCTFPTMIDDWREKFNEGSGGQTSTAFPFGFVQLSGWRNDSSQTLGFPEIRWHQTADFGYVPNDRMENVFMAVAMDLPDFASPWTGIHPRDKQDVAMRLMTAGLAVAYKQPQYSKLNGPFPSMFTIFVGEGTVQIDYDNKTTALDILSTEGFEATCIYLANSTGNTTGWLPLPMTSHDNTSVTLNYSKLCLQSKDMLVDSIRYAWRESPCAFKACAVYNKESGYPAPPFTKNLLDGRKKNRHSSSPHVKYINNDRS